MADKDNRSEGPITASVERLRTELDRWLDVAMTQGGKALDVMGLRNSNKTWTPHIDLVESPDDVTVCVSLPGTDPEAVDVTIAGNMLTIKGETPAICSGDNDTIHLRQIDHGPFQRSIPMPVPVECESVTAQSHDGILTVRLAKSERAKTRQIPVNVDSGAP